MNIRLNLPQIAVVGSQSSGKSSVLEAIVGKDFLPRGSGIVTRCPIVLQLVQQPPSTKEEWGEFLHKPDKKYYDFSEINGEIQNRTVEIAGTSAITDRPINLKIYSPHVLNLTLVDLPGLVMNAVGDQPKDIDRQIKEMVTRYVSPANTIILAISPANTDLATSASLRLARQLDPEGLRTVGVLTKLDLMDRGTDALDILTGKVIGLRHGFVGVVNRSQQDINDSKGMEAAREDERAFFHDHPAYSAIADTQGTEYLAKKLNYLLLEHIKVVIPDLKAHLGKLMESTRKQMERLGMCDYESVDPEAMLLTHIKLFNDTLNHTIDGGMTDATKELLGGARLDYIFNECFASYVSDMVAGEDLTDEHIRINIRNMAGMRPALFPSDHVFVALSREQIARLEDPSTKCVQFVYEELIKIVDICSTRVDRFPKLKQAIVDICRQSLLEYRIPTMAHVRTIIAAERDFINVKHPKMEELAQQAFNKVFTLDPENKEQKQQQQKHGNSNGNGRDKKGVDESAPTSGERRNMEEVPSTVLLDRHMSLHERQLIDSIREMVEGYFTIVKGSVADHVPKAIVFLMITKLRKEVYSTLVQHLYTVQNMNDLLEETPEVAKQRESTATMMEALKKAQAALERVRGFTFLTK